MNTEQLFEIARQQAEKHGLMFLTLQGVCDAAGIPSGSFSHVAKMTFTEMVEKLRGTVPHHVDGVEYTRRVSGDLRRDQMVAVALELAREHGYDKVTGPMVAKRVGLSKASVMHRFGTMDVMRESIMLEAVETGDASVVAQGLVNRNEVAMNAPDAVKEKALQHLANL